MKIKLSAFVLSLAVCTHANALTMRPVEHTCPIGGEKFTSDMLMSGVSVDVKTDLEPLGAIMAPTPIPICPSNQFVMFKDDFTQQELDKYEKIIQSEAYLKQVAEKASAQRLLGVMLELAGENQNTEQMEWIFLQASWLGSQRQDLEKVLHYADLNLKDGNQHIEKLTTMKFVRGEMLRKLGRFDEAKKQFEELSKEPTVKASEYLQKLTELELELTAEKDIYSHPVRQTLRLRGKIKDESSQL